MTPVKQPLSSLTLLYFALVSSCIISIAQAVIEDVFRVQTGGVDQGGCDDYTDKLNAWFDDSIHLANLAFEGTNPQDRELSKYLTGFFAIDAPPLDAEYRDQARGRLW